MFCPFCGTPLDDDALTCHACNAPVEPLEQSPEPTTENQPEADAAQEIPEATEEIPAPKKRSPIPRILLTVFGIAAALAAVVALAIYLLPILAGKGPATALYIKDNELYTTRLAKLQPWQVTDKLIDASNSQLAGYDKNSYAGLMADYTYLTRDGRILFYPDKFTPSDEGVTIYYRNIKNPEEDPQKLDSSIYQYTVSPDGSRVVYLKSDGTLYRYNMQEKTKVATGIATEYLAPHFYTSEDCKNLIYMVANKYNAYNVYAQTEGGQRQRLASDCVSIQYINNACNTLYYLDGDSDLYKVTVGQEKVKIAYDVSRIFRIYDSGEIYYTTGKAEDGPTVTPGQFVTDDVKTDTSRDPIRQALADAAPMDIQYADALCYYDGKESHTLAQDCIFDAQMQSLPTAHYDVAADTPMLVYSCFTITNVEKVKLSQVTNYQELTEKIAENFQNAHCVYVSAKGTATEFQCQSQGITAKDIRITDDGKTGYYLVKSKADAQAGELYKFAITDGKPQKAELYASSVYQYAFLDSSTVLYYCDYSQNKSTADLYVNQVLVEYDTAVNSYVYDSDSKRLYYFIDWDKDHMDGTLKFWEDGDAVKISDDVYTFEYFDDEVLYLTDYDADKGHGTLYLFQNDESYEVDTEVSHIIGSSDHFGFVFGKTVLAY